ncbi:MAG: T9SS type A sorting domain-containing protein [Flavobacteriaceae bacterium]
MKTLSTLLLVLTMSFTIGLANLLAQPQNDLIANAYDLGFGPIPYDEAAVDFPNATNTNDNTPGGTGCALSQAGVWYKFTATKEGTVTAGIFNPNGAVIIFFEGPETGVTSGMQLTHVNQGNNPCASNPLASIQTTIGTTYYLYMRNTVVSDIGINTSTIFKVPDNDLIENATDINGLEDYFEEDIHFLMTTGTNDGGQQGGCDTLNTPGIWYKFTAGTDGQVVAGISSAVNEGGIIFFSAEDENATSGSELTWVNSPDNPCGAGNLRSINAIAGTTYYVFTGMFDPYGDFSINLSQILNNSEHTIIDFNYYPNPVVNQFNFNSKSTIDNIKIYTLLGQLVLNQDINNNSGSIDMSQLSKGMYLAEVTSGEHKTTAKILKK